MSFDIDVRGQVGARGIAVAFRTDARLVALVGRSGAGKTSVLNMVAGLIRPAAGHVRVGGVTLFGDGVDLPPERRRIGYVFQDGRLFPHRRVRWNLLYGQRFISPGDRWLSPEVAIGLLGIGGLLDRWPATLSGGEAQRVAIGRALLSGPRALLLDEPLKGLDAARRGELLSVVERLRDELGLPILYVSHDRTEVDRLAGLVVEVDGGDA